MKDTYFAYGSNMDPAKMHFRCPGASALGVAVLADHEVAIGHRGVATITRSLGAFTYGVLWHLDPGHEETLDRVEGIRLGLYRREFLPVDLDGEKVIALTYVENLVERGDPRPGYLETILSGARHFALPVDYVNRLVNLGGAE